MIEVDCVKCGMIIYAVDEAEGLERQCPSCGTMNVVVQRAEDEPIVEAEIIEAPPSDPPPPADPPATVEAFPEDPPADVAERVEPPPVFDQAGPAAEPSVSLGPPPLPDADDLAADALDDMAESSDPPPPAPPAVAVQSQVAQPVAPLKGLGGWLIIPCTHLVISMITIPAGRDRAYARVEDFKEELSEGGSWPRPIEDMRGMAEAMDTCVRTVSVGWYLYLAFTIFVMVQFFRKRREAPMLMKVCYGVAIGLTWIQGLWLGTIDQAEMFGHGLIGITVFSVIWIAYFSMSERVENTFTGGPVKAHSP